MGVLDGNLVPKVSNRLQHATGTEMKVSTRACGELLWAADWHRLAERTGLEGGQLPLELLQLLVPLHKADVAHAPQLPQLCHCILNLQLPCAIQNAQPKRIPRSGRRSGHGNGTLYPRPGHPELML